MFVKAGTAIALALMVALSACKETAKTDQPVSMVITFTSGDVKVVRDGKEVAAAIGMIVYEKDLIKTENGTVDLQTRTGSAVRVREMTSLTVSKIAGTDGGNTQLNIDHGGMLANVKKASANEGFNVATPTAIAGVRGTTFSVEVDPFEKTSNVKVLDGKVAMSPRLVALESKTADEIAQDPTLKKMAEIQNVEVVLDEKTEGRLSPQVEKQVLAINELTEKAAAQDNDHPIRKELEEATRQIETTVVAPEKAILKSEAQITEQDIVEKETLVTVSDKVLEKLESGKDPQTTLNDMKEIRMQKQDQVLKQIEANATKEKLQSETEIKKHYNRLEVIVLKDGSEITGAVIAQTGDILVIHSPQGVRRVSKDQIASQEFR